MTVHFAQYTHWTPTLIDELRGLAEKGLTWAQAGKIMGLKEKTVQSAARRHSIESQVQPPEWTPVQDFEIVIKRHDGKTFEQIAATVSTYTDHPRSARACCSRWHRIGPERRARILKKWEEWR